MEHSYVIIDSNPETIYAIQLAMENFNNFICIGIASNEQDGLDIILERTPSLVFLNIELEHNQYWNNWILPNGCIAEIYGYHSGIYCTGTNS